MQNRVKVPINRSFQTVIQMISVLYLMIWSVAPPLQMDLVFRLAALGLAFVWFLIEFFHRFEFTVMQIWCALFMVAVALIAYIKNGASSVISEIAVYMMVLAFFINIYSSDSWMDYRMVVPITIILLIVFNYLTSKALAEDASISRQLVRDSIELYSYMKRGIGGYGLVYPQVCIAPVIYAWALKSLEHNKFYFLLGIAWSISFWSVLNNAGYSIAVITSAISLVILVFYRKKNIVPAVAISIVLIVTIVLLLVYVESFRNFVMRIFEGTKVVRKIEDLVSTAEGEMADSFATRIDRYWRSIYTSLQYPLIGSILFNGMIGGHSEILDTFAKYGVWGGIPVLTMIFYTPLSFKKKARTSTVIATANAHIVAIALFSLFDPFVFQVYFPLLILCPVMYTQIMYWTGELNEHSLDSESDPAQRG